VGIRESDREILEYRDLMSVPDKFEQGISLRTVVGAFFIGFIMMPGAIYLGLLVGGNLGPAAEWVTIILFTEAARRSFQTVSRQEIYLLYYLAGTLTAFWGGLALAGGPFAALIWNQYFAQSPAAASFAGQIPDWVVPRAGSEALDHRTFMQAEWIAPIVILMVGNVLARVNGFTGAYALFRITSDIERLPFPMAPVAAQGATALAESSAKEEGWRWRVFSIGTMIGLSFGLIYVAVPTLTGVALVKPINILPIPWIDFTTGTESILPGVPMALATDLSAILVGFVLPFWVVIGGVAGFVITLITNPILVKTNVLHQWKPGMGIIDTLTANSLDFWLSFSIGMGFAIAIVGVVGIVQAHLHRKKALEKGNDWRRLPATRGDFHMGWTIVLFVLSTIGYIVLCAMLVPDFNVAFFIMFGFFWTPLISYVTARMVGLSGQFVGFPMVLEATYVLSGYKGVAIWFAPIPYNNYGTSVTRFREFELLGGNFRGLLKAELLSFPILMLCSFIFWEFVWRMAAIPSAQFQYCNEFWPLIARQRALFITGTTESPELFMQAINATYIGAGLGLGLVAYYALQFLGMPTLLIYGLTRGLGQAPSSVVPELFGACLGRYYFAKRFGLKRWREYAPVLLAGYACGMGLVSMISIAVALISKSISQTPF